jgi:phage terminase small subunit
MSAPYIFAGMPRDIITGLSVKERAFVEQYMIDLDPGEAIRRAELYKGAAPTPANLKAAGQRLLNRESVRLALHWLQSQRARQAEVNADEVLKHLWAMVKADPTEISSVRVFSCRHCFGEDFQYQWINEVEFSFAKKRVPDLTDDGGYGYDPEIRPHPKCPHCKGLGERSVVLADSRDYSEDAKLLYRGAKMTRNGIEVLTHDSMKALDMVSKIIGLYGNQDPTENQVQIVVKGGLPD